MLCFRCLWTVDNALGDAGMGCRFKVVFTRVRDSAVEHIALNALKAHTARATRGESPSAAGRSLGEEEMKVDEATLAIIKRVGRALFSTGVDPALVFLAL